jgi:hypothetical protein
MFSVGAVREVVRDGSSHGFVRGTAGLSRKSEMMMMINIRGDGGHGHEKILMAEC